MQAIVATVMQVLSHPRLVAITTIVSIVLFVGSIALVPWLVARLPADYFKRDDHVLGSIRRPGVRLALAIAKNVLGAMLVIMGLAMLVLPGQGLLTLVVALLLLDFPGKRALERRVVSHPRVLRTLNSLRHRAGREPLVVD